MEKMTKRDYFAILKGMVEDTIDPMIDKEKVLAFIAHEVELLDKKHTSKKDTEKQKANEILLETVYGIVANATSLVSVADVMKALSDIDIELTNQKVSYLLNSLASADRLVKVYDKKKPFYSV